MSDQAGDLERMRRLLELHGIEPADDEVATLASRIEAVQEALRVFGGIADSRLEEPATVFRLRPIANKLRDPK